MPYKEHQVKKIYWKIGEVSGMLNIKQCKIRFWIKELGIEISRNRKDARIFTEINIQLLRKIKFMREEGYQLQGILKNLNKYSVQENNQVKRIEI